MLRIKEGVKLEGLTTRMLVVLQVAEGAFKEGGHDCIVTSALDGIHGEKSFHYQGDAVDIRTNTLNEKTIETVVALLKFALPGFDIILEDLNGSNEHLHIEPNNEHPRG